MVAYSATTYVVHQNGETLEHRLDADKNEHHAADNLRAIAQQMAEALADGQRHNAAEERRNADNAYRGRYGNAHCAQAHAHGERIDARSYGLHQNHLERQRVAIFRNFLFPITAAAQGARAFFNHISADKAKNHQRDDARVRFDEVTHDAAQEIAQQRHSRLDDAERDWQRKQACARGVRIAEDVRDGYGEGVHGQRNAQKNDLYDAHVQLFFRIGSRVRDKSSRETARLQRTGHPACRPQHMIARFYHPATPKRENFTRCPKAVNCS